MEETMKARTSVLASLLLMTAPAIVADTFEETLGSATSWLPLLPGEAHAQDKVTELAREKFMEGVKAYDANQFEQARTLFLQAYALKRHPAVLLNLGQSELKAGYLEDGGNHLQQFLREHKDATPDQRKAAEAGIQEAQRKTAFLIVIVDADGANVGVDGQSVGQAPLLEPYFVKPGKHEVSASLDGKSAKSEADAKRGTATPVTITLGIAGHSPPPVVAPVPTPATPVPQPDYSGQPQPPPGYPPPGPLGPAPQPGVGMGMDGPDTGGGRQAFFPWFVDTPIAWVGAGLTGVGLIGAIAFGAAAANASSSADEVSNAIKAEAARLNNVPENRQPCGPPDQPQFDLAYYEDACAQLRDNIDAYDVDIVGVAIFAAVGGAAAIGTVVYYFIDSDGKGSASLQVTPVITADTQGFGLSGSF
jgi:hypothetical protein